MDGFLNEATVLGQDLFGRFTVSEAMGIWNGYKAKWSEMAISPLVLQMVHGWVARFLRLVTFDLRILEFACLQQLSHLNSASRNIYNQWCTLSPYAFSTSWSNQSDALWKPKTAIRDTSLTTIKSIPVAQQLHHVLLSWRQKPLLRSISGSHIQLNFLDLISSS